jgi:hypothetical protein
MKSMLVNMDTFNILKENESWRQLAKRLLNPDDLGFAVNDEVRRLVRTNLNDHIKQESKVNESV